MNISRAFDETLKKYGVTGAALARKANISPSHVSQFRNSKGGDVTHTSLEKMLEAMESLAPGSKLYFCLLVAGKNPVEYLSGNLTDLSSLVLAASPHEKAQIFYALGRWVVGSRETTDTATLPEAV
ncbi:hypothetical protein WA1_50140 [Scytonema hofmannii PCC 7110]|uniref:Uncharacterized protein n=1 Tax=Scytonema hofmannii PCC 7110 TaxID=128403 RepID=A0A139WR35_9CYAN|nr:helix-turn-helix transcriptional regulator [Scytonema hofmannii]KYC34889.1 hypothetical protein WA1_50140 [Scytonema hofmannii PCC 7110]